MVRERKPAIRKTPQTEATPPADGRVPQEKNRALMGIEEWYAEVTKREDVREILTELAK